MKASPARLTLLDPDGSPIRPGEKDPPTQAPTGTGMPEGCPRDEVVGGILGSKCGEVSEKLSQIFGWRHTYKVHKLQRCLAEELACRQIQQFKVRATAASAKVTPSETDKSASAWVAVDSLTSTDGGLLDPDDRLADVADDREQLRASYQESDAGSGGVGGVLGHGGGDGASGGSSVGTGSPDMFTHIDVGVEHLATGAAPLQVRRGSEPALHRIATGTPSTGAPTAASASLSPSMTSPPNGSAEKKWSGGIISEHGESTKKNHKSNGCLNSEWELSDKEIHRERERERPPAYGRFARDGSNRLSIQFVGDSGMRWADAAERAAMGYVPNHVNQRGQSLSLPREHRRKEPLGHSNSTSPTGVGQSNELEDGLEMVVLRNEAGPLGIHVVPDYDQMGKERGLLIQAIEQGGRVDRDSRLQVYDRIIEINGRNLLNMPFDTVEEIFKNSLRSPELRLKVVKHRSGNPNYAKKPPAPVFPRANMDKENIAFTEPEQKAVGGPTKVATVSPTKKVTANSNYSGSLVRNAATALLTANTRRLGRRLSLELTKGAYGLGFSITTRDNPAGGFCPIYIKNILPKGAAVEDGRLRPGDRLLEVNGEEMTGKTQDEAVTMLRKVPAGGVVRLVVSRLDDAAGTSPQSAYTDSSSESSGEFSNSATDCVVSENNQNYGKDVNANKTNQSNESLTGSIRISDKSDDSLAFPWKHKEILQFDIPVHDTEKAGLGVSVKGKTSANHSVSNVHATSYDLGIFVKSVLHGGAASRDGRLRTNDQLLNVNGESLLNQSNADAMDTLRRAMLRTDRPIPGVITLTIARRAGSPSPSGQTNSGTEQLNKNEETTCTPDNSGTSENSDNTVIFLPHKEQERSVDRSGSLDHSFDHNLNCSIDRSLDSSLEKSLDSSSLRNPVLDRLTGHQQNALRNESYYRATHDTTWNTTVMSGGFSPADRPAGHLTSPTVNPSGGEMVYIEETTSYPSDNTNRGRRRESESSDSRQNYQGQPPVLQHQQSQQSEQSTISEIHGDVTYASQLSLDENAAGFSRDAFGRQSMSEKRHGTLDAKNTDTYQRNKKLREEREKQKHNSGSELGSSIEARFPGHSPSHLLRATSVESVASNSRPYTGREYKDPQMKNELGPSLGMKKSSSLESLQTMVQEIQMQEDSDPAYSYRNAQGAVRVIRGRGCNESFRAAVDRSYEAPLALSELRDRMETLTEEDNGMMDPLSLPSFSNVRGAPRQSSLNAAMDNKHKMGKKKPGILKGIGSMFRFGKHRKGTDNRVEDEDADVDHEEIDHEKARRAAQDEQQRIQEQYRRLLQQQRQRQEQEDQQEAGSLNGSEGSCSRDNSPPAHSRTQRIHQLRAQHQRRHVERQGHYPLDEREECYEQVIRQRLDQPYQHHSQYKHHQPQRQSTYDMYGEMTRPGSRVGITEPKHRFSHYVNYEEIQQHLSDGSEHLTDVDIFQMRQQVHLQRLKVDEESRRQQHYHSQRGDNRALHPRPVSNFYEYESVQAMMRANQQRMVDCANSNSLPRRSPQETCHSRTSVHMNGVREGSHGGSNSHGGSSSHGGSGRSQGGYSRLYHPNGYGPSNGSVVHHQQSVTGRHQGPFVTQVTIRESSHVPGSKV